MIREKVLRSTRDEVPHSIAVEIDEFKVRDNDDIYIPPGLFADLFQQASLRSDHDTFLGFTFHKNIGTDINIIARQ